MTARAILVSLVVLIPGLLRAQQPPQDPFKASQRSGWTYSHIAAAPGTANEHRMYEDIEIFRRILERKLQALYPAQLVPGNPWIYPNYMGMMGMQGGSMLGMQGGSMMGMSGGSMLGMQGGSMMGTPSTGYWTPNTALSTVYYPSPKQPSLQLEGVYLKGQGIVYTVTLPSLHPTAKPKPAARKMSEWESVRLQVLAEKEKSSKPVEDKAPGLKEVLLKAMAENGHHFKLLGDNESLTLVITVRQYNPPSPAKKTSGTSATKQPREGIDDRSAVGSAKLRELMLLADLHLKHNRYEDALKVLKQGLRELEGAKLKASTKEKAELYRKVAQAYLGLDKIDEARGTLDQAAALLKKTQYTKTVKPPVPPVPVTLPTKLILSAPKKLLVLAGEDKITNEQFAAQAHVELVKPSR